MGEAVMADDERRAEIEAAARAFLPETPITHPAIGEIGPDAPAAIRYEQRRKTLAEALDRVRDARGDDEKQWACDACEDTGIDRREGIPCGCGARSPQGEGHETARPEQPPPDTLGGQPPAEP